MGKKKQKEVELNETNIILKIPENAASLTVIANMVDADGKLMKVQKTLSVQDIFKARQDFLDNVEGGDDYDAKFVLTEEGKAYLEQLLEEKSVGA